MRWISAQNLQEWSNRILARTTFPGLIADLITASSPNINEFRFPNREKGQVRGFDGILEAKAFLPSFQKVLQSGSLASLQTK